MHHKSRKMLKILGLLFAVVMIAMISGCSDDDESSTGPDDNDSSYVYIFDDTIEPGDSVHLIAGENYLASGFVFVDSGAILSMDPGTVVKFRPGQGVNASALIVARYGKIYANGTADNPIILTAQADDVDDPGDLPLTAKGLWGGLIILGDAPNNNTDGIGQVEGIPSDEERGAFGGDNSASNSGVVRYVSIRHGGSEIGAGNEINGLTLGSVGSGTTIEYIEVFSNLDDGVEFFGGTVNTKHIAVAFCGDDCYDYDEGFNGKGQFWFAIQMATDGNRGGEHDGATGNEQATPYAIPVISNATYIGSGTGASNADNDYAIIMRDNAGGQYYNSIFYDFVGGGLTVEDMPSSTHPEDSRGRLEDGDMIFENNVWYSFGAGNTAEGIWDQDFVRTYMTDPNNDNDIVDPVFGGVSRSGGGLDPRPSAAEATSGADIPGDSFFDQVSYKGAFDPSGTLWLSSWTALSEYGFVQ